MAPKPLKNISGRAPPSGPVPRPPGRAPTAPGRPSHCRYWHGAPLPELPERRACAFVAVSFQPTGSLVCPGCRRRFATPSSLRRHLSGRYRRPPSTFFQPLNRVQPPPGRLLRFRVHDAARPQRARAQYLALRLAAPGSAEVEVWLPVRTVCLRTARKEASGLCRNIDMKRDDRSLIITADAPTVALEIDVLLLPIRAEWAARWCRRCLRSSLGAASGRVGVDGAGGRAKGGGRRDGACARRAGACLRNAPSVPTARPRPAAGQLGGSCSTGSA